MATNEEIKFTPKTLGLILVILTIISICSSAVIAYSVTNEQAKHNTQDIKGLQTTYKETLNQVNENTINVAVLNTIAEDVKDIKQDIKLFHTGK